MDKGVIGCLAVVGGAALVFFLLSIFWGVVIAGGPIAVGLLMAVCFAAGVFFGSN